MNNNDKPSFFSVVIPLYNKEKYIKRTLDSVLNQTFTDFEIVIVDDGSKDNSCEIVEAIDDPHIRLVLQENGGPSKARNRGIKEAKGKFIAFLDADDEWLPEKLQKQYDLHSNNPDIVWSCSAYKVIGGRKEQVVSYTEEGILDDAIDAIVEGLSIWTSTVVIRKDIYINERFLFNENFKTSEDRELWYKMACVFPRIGYIQKSIALYRVNVANSLTANTYDDFDFSFLSLIDRISSEMNTLESTKKEKLFLYLQEFNRKAIFSFWAQTIDFSSFEKQIKIYIDNSTLRRLKQWQYLPVVVKKMIVKINRSFS